MSEMPESEAKTKTDDRCSIVMCQQGWRSMRDLEALKWEVDSMIGTDHHDSSEALSKSAATFAECRRRILYSTGIDFRIDFPDPVGRPQLFCLTASNTKQKESK